jgi:hypothetical protein
MHQILKPIYPQYEHRILMDQHHMSNVHINEISGHKNMTRQEKVSIKTRNLV